MSLSSGQGPFPSKTEIMVFCSIWRNFEATNRKEKSVFAVDKKMLIFFKSTKDSVPHSLASLGVKVLAIIAGTSYAFWDVLLPFVENSVALTERTLETKDLILRTKYLG